MTTRIVSAFAVVLLAPAAAWLVWIAPVGESASDARHVLWFVTVAVGAVVAGTIAPFDASVFVGLWTAALVSTLVTLHQWWSSVDVTGLFMVGIAMAASAILVCAPVLLLVGGAVGTAMRRSTAGVG